MRVVENTQPKGYWYLKVYNVDTDGVESYVIEFHKKHELSSIGELHFIDINSRRKLSQISDDLQELNNIQRSRLKEKEIKFLFFL
jgi:hypothetical protein